MKKIIFIYGKAIEYELTFKKVKNINLRIHRDGKITVSASKRVPVRFIEEFLISRSDFITSALEKFSKINKPSFEYNNGDELVILGRSYTVKNELGSRNTAEITDDNLVTLYTTDNSYKSRRKAVIRLYDSICETEILSLCRTVFEELKGICQNMPEISFRKARSRWGSCYSTKKKIVLNKLLAAAPIECVRYVIYHEFIHFMHPDHSKNFYSELEKHLPEHRYLKKKLNAYSYVLDFPSDH